MISDFYGFVHNKKCMNLLSHLYNVLSYHSSVTFWCQKWDPFDLIVRGHYCKTKYVAYAGYASNYNCFKYFLFMNSTGYQKGLEG